MYFQEFLETFSNQDHQSLITGLKDFTSLGGKRNIFQLFEEEHHCTTKLSHFILYIKKEFSTIRGFFLHEGLKGLSPDRLEDLSTDRYIRTRNCLNRLANACHDAARDCRCYIRIIEWMANEWMATEEEHLPEDLNAELLNLRLQEITLELQRLLKGIIDELPAPEFNWARILVQQLEESVCLGGQV